MSLRLVKYIRGFTEGARLDWLHPSNGPFPDFAAIYQDSEIAGEFEVLAWDDRVSWISMVCGPDHYHGGYPHSYRWWPDAPEPKIVTCRPTKGEIYDVNVNWEAGEAGMLKQVSTASVRLHILTEPYPEGWA